MIADAELIRAAILNATAEELDEVLSCVEGYQACAATAERLHRNRCRAAERARIMDCVGYYCRQLEAFARVREAMPARGPVWCGRLRVVLGIPQTS